MRATTSDLLVSSALLYCTTFNMNDEDRRMQSDERDASPQRFPAEAVEEPRPTHLRRHATGDTLSSTSSFERNRNNISRFTTQRDDVDLARHPTSLSRIATARSQHSHTVGTSLRSRTARRHDSTPLPAFGGGKDYPPELPDKELFIVEFDGPLDPMHAQVSMALWSEARLIIVELANVEEATNCVHSRFRHTYSCVWLIDLLSSNTSCG